VGGSGTIYLLNDAWSGRADTALLYGRDSDRSYVGDWNGDGKDSLAVRRGRTYHLRNALTGGPADVTFEYGLSTDTTLVGDWNGDGIDTAAVRRGNVYYVSNGFTGGAADIVQAFGEHPTPHSSATGTGTARTPSGCAGGRYGSRRQRAQRQGHGRTRCTARSSHSASRAP